jgi:hypothetical protein
MNEPLSATRITTWLACGLRYYFRYVARVEPQSKPAALAFGHAIHSSLEAFHVELINRHRTSADQIIDIFRADWAAAQLDELRFKEGEDAPHLEQLGIALVRSYVIANANLPVIASEVRFDVPLLDPTTGEVIAGLFLRGVFDVILEGDGILEIKTAARAYDEGTLSRHIQLSAYHYSYRYLYDRDPTIRVTALLKQRRPKIDDYPVTRTIEDDAWFVHLAAQIARGIDAGVFAPNPSWQCSDCEYANQCRAWRGEQAGAALQR